MSIIRQIANNFVVPDLRNSATVVRLLILVISMTLLLPLLTDSPLGYTEEIYRHVVWITPVLLLILAKAYFVSKFIPALLNNKYSFFISYFSNLLIFVFVERMVLGNNDLGSLAQHFFLYNLIALGFMYNEAFRRNSLAPSVSEARLSALTARIRPHFLFNSLNAAISLIRLRPYDAETLLENLANLFRAQLRDGSQSSTLGQEIEWAKEYIAIEQIRMGHMRVQVMWQHQAPDDAETPHLLLQPLLENAVFHGVESTHRPGMITVLTRLNRNAIYIRIENPFTPPESSENVKPHKGNSMALRNLQERLALMYDYDAKIQSRELDGIFRVDIKLPYRKRTSDVARLFG
ncbi:sensor histidine kinase [Neisseria chenwenguii]|uniref:Sensor histidine kinase n=1 Tax=Neisseria chenwenguii TaxID=1853278 RepID=A0A220S021_9NEIS|nr:histidine kinase [Neisseria chenwenguii]ASK26742.1 sensor histidine kinase [Neisseria chenwenguii]